jgi:MFS transporter, FHS family, L-fucose permease
MQNNKSALYTLMNVWFFWGFVAAANGILIPLFKERFNLLQWQSQLVDFAFYAAYFVGSILYFVVSAFMKGDILNKIGYKNGIVYGLLISAVGTLMFIPAANSQSFPLLLVALFIVGLGFSLQQTATQPFMIALGDPAKGAQRINMGGAVNNFGTTISPVIVSYAIFGSLNDDAVKQASIESIKVPYLGLGILFLIVAAIFHFSKLPRITNEEKVEIGTGVLKYPQLVMGMAAIFLYVGVEVTIGSNLGEYLSKTEKLDSSAISQYVSLFWGSMMMGRWVGALPNFEMSKTIKNIMTIVLPFLAFGVVLGVNALRGTDVTPLFPYAICVIGLIAAFFLSEEKPVKTMMLFTGLGALAMAIGLLTTGKIALFAFISGGLFCSVLWPCIMALSIAGLGKYTNQGAAYLIMMILGGAIIPVLQGGLADMIGIQESYIVALLCFVLLFLFAYLVQGVLCKQGIDFDKDIAMIGGH